MAQFANSESTTSVVHKKDAMVFNPFSNETKMCKVLETGLIKEDSDLPIQTGEAFFPLDNEKFSVLCAVTKYKHESKWMVIGAPKK